MDVKVFSPNKTSTKIKPVNTLVPVDLQSQVNVDPVPREQTRVVHEPQFKYHSRLWLTEVNDLEILSLNGRDHSNKKTVET